MRFRDIYFNDYIQNRTLTPTKPFYFIELVENATNQAIVQTYWFKLCMSTRSSCDVSIFKFEALM